VSAGVSPCETVCGPGKMLSPDDFRMRRSGLKRTLWCTSRVVEGCEGNSILPAYRSELHICKSERLRCGLDLYSVDRNGPELRFAGYPGKAGAARGFWVVLTPFPGGAKEAHRYRSLSTVSVGIPSVPQAHTTLQRPWSLVDELASS
jgi:hypothetical protein